MSAIDLHFSAIDFHFSAIDCMLQFFRSFAYVSLCNRFTLLVQSIAYLKFSKRLLLFLSAIDLHCSCNRLHSLTFCYWLCMQSICIDSAIDCTLKFFEKIAVETLCNRFTQRVQSIACCTILKNNSFSHTCSSYLFIETFHSNLEFVNDTF